MDACNDRIASELRRLEHGRAARERPGGIGLHRVYADCPGDAESVLRRSTDVLGAVDRVVLAGWPEEAAWAGLLPAWFVQRCGPALSAAEYEAIDRRLRRRKKWMQWTKRQNMSDRDWPLSNWVHWFQPENRHWFWWGGKAIHPELVMVEIEIDGAPFPWAALSWLLRASGATAVYDE